jgi:hypothetical protein
MLVRCWIYCVRRMRQRNFELPPQYWQTAIAGAELSRLVTRSIRFGMLLSCPMRMGRYVIEFFDGHFRSISSRISSAQRTAGGYCSDGRGHTSPPVVLRQFPSSEDRSHDPDYSFAALIHVLKFISFAFHSLLIYGIFVR